MGHWEGQQAELPFLCPCFWACESLLLGTQGLRDCILAGPSAAPLLTTQHSISSGHTDREVCNTARESQGTPTPASFTVSCQHYMRSLPAEQTLRVALAEALRQEKHHHPELVTTRGYTVGPSGQKGPVASICPQVARWSR